MAHAATPEGQQHPIRLYLLVWGWLFMLFVWMVLLSLLAGWASDFITFCQQLLN